MDEIMACRNNCYFTDKEVFRCPKCGEILVSAGEATRENAERLQKEIIERQEAYRKDLH